MKRFVIILALSLFLPALAVSQEATAPSVTLSTIQRGDERQFVGDGGGDAAAG